LYRVGAAALASLALAAVAGCGGLGLGSVSVGSSVEDPATAAGGNPDAGTGDAATNVPVVESPDAGFVDAAKGASPFLGSPLCGVTVTTCDPDQLACNFDVTDSSPGECKVASVCSGSSDVSQQSAACRVVDSLPVCAVIGPNTEGTSCMTSSDCGAELECVPASGGSGAAGDQGICRRYCCELTCPGKHSFCDIEQVLGVSQLVPVCNTSTATCAPLGNDCPYGQSCTVVEEDSVETTACVAPGTGAVGTDCTTAKCGANLACISGTCQALCLMGTDCPSPQKCMPLLGLSDGIGVCSAS
jgi:hypothetical protein